ncbi:MAG: nucleotidyltransferase family protein [Clostridia bacterium]|nr:nucleotidyltransferase family protein [Clostridia bacterium]
MINVIILAGFQEIKNYKGDGNKALIQINGKAIIEYVIEAVKGADNIDKIVVVGNKSELEMHLKDRVDTIIDTNGTIIENLVAGIKYLSTEKHVLVCSSDIPFITAEAINDFVNKSRELGADLCYPIVEKGVNDRKFPEMERTYVKVREGAFTGGNIFYINPKIIESRLHIAEKLLELRKKPLKMAGLLNSRFMLQLLMGTLSINKIEKKFSSIMNINAKAVISQYPEVGSDIDKVGDVVVAAAYLDR